MDTSTERTYAEVVRGEISESDSYKSNISLLTPALAKEPNTSQDRNLPSPRRGPSTAPQTSKGDIVVRCDFKTVLEKAASEYSTCNSMLSELALSALTMDKEALTAMIDKWCEVRLRSKTKADLNPKPSHAKPKWGSKKNRAPTRRAVRKDQFKKTQDLFSRNRRVLAEIAIGTKNLDNVDINETPPLEKVFNHYKTTFQKSKHTNTK